MKAHRIVKLNRLTGHYFYPPAPSSKSKTTTITTKTTMTKNVYLFLAFKKLSYYHFSTSAFFSACRVVSNGNKRLYTKNMMHHPEYRGPYGNFSCAPAVNKTSLEETARHDKENGQRPCGQKRARFFFCFIVLVL